MYFLERIAKLLYEENCRDLRNHCLVFPNRRAGLYFLKYLSEQIDKPVWTPAIMTINEFFNSFSHLHVADNEVLLFELYKVYRKVGRSAEGFDEFYFWGDMLLNDFDDIDKYLADAAVLFRNVEDFKNIDLQFGDIDKEKADIIKRFWKNFEPGKPSVEKSDFKTVWSILFDLYSEFKTTLRSLNLAYEGMIFRDVADSFSVTHCPELKWDCVHFIGFNALNRCEETLMKRLQKEALAKFYWDYDNSYIKGGKLNSAGLFLNRNLKFLKNDMPDDWDYNTLLSSDPSLVKRKIIETTSDISQVKLLPDLISLIPGLSPANAHHTAVILSDENLIVPVLTSLPENSGDINITMGYPLKMTGVYSLVKHLLNLQRNATLENGMYYFSHRDVLGILKHQLAVFLLNDEDRKITGEITEKNMFKVPADFIRRTDSLKFMFRVAETPAQLSEFLREILTAISGHPGTGSDADENSPMQNKLSNEFIYRMLLSVNRLDNLIHSPGISFRTETYIRILDKLLRSQSVPFSGEPLSGIQVMGILETRALDFRNIIMLSVNEGILPSVTAASSFIPFSIREAFGLPTINHQESIFAYHFYRLLQRAENVTFVFNSNSDGVRTGEMSRFLIQMKYEHIIEPGILNLNFDIKTPVAVCATLPKSQLHLDRLSSLYLNGENRTVLSPTAINTWLGCRMQFYYRYVNGLKEAEVISSEIDHALFGKILHSIMKNIYDDRTGRSVSKEFLDLVIKNEPGLLEYIDRTVNSNFRTGIEKSPEGNELIIKDILLFFIHRILDVDRSLTPFSVIGLEKLFFFNLDVMIDGVQANLKTGGTIDRIDSLNGCTRIVDYKTGEVALKISDVSVLFVNDRKKDLDGWLQTLLYCEAYLNGNSGSIIKPSIYKIKELSGEDFTDSLKMKSDNTNDTTVENYQMVRSAFIEGLKDTVARIFSRDEPFVMTADQGKCRYCPYRKLCQK